MASAAVHLFRILFLCLLCQSISAQPLRIFAAASLKESLDQIAADWRAESGHEISLVFAGSSALARQVEAGAPADIFFSADQEWMDYLDERGLIDPATRLNLLGNGLVLIAPAAAHAKIDLRSPDSWLLAMGDNGRLAIAEIASVPAGRYARQSMVALGIWSALEGRLAQAENVRAAMAFVALGEAPLGIVYATDARVEPRVRVLTALPSETHDAIVYPLARVSAAAAEPAGRFIQHLKSPSARKVFKDAGFQLLDVQR